ncbi:hypothetical protein H257_12837 [Aphanomyces astaci]|uniref:Uncharacterized protein n=1 Tax=Aphanomyces astaci TaxID=112090 RepID=W4FZ25_APHAT|nr:hypothetical protein H257_12837 [Aphanomyces astaci]ETV72034.1 hypothetical protein H257_12837 [Aphanomyces astaci]|eukprot:XP_009838477.1 hypothetical protein H257_12837 [Aphanomyces astaci]
MQTAAAGLTANTTLQWYRRLKKMGGDEGAVGNRSRAGGRHLGADQTRRFSHATLSGDVEREPC